MDDSTGTNSSRGATSADLRNKKGDFPVSEKLAEESLALPIHAELPLEDIESVSRAIRAFYA